MGGLREGSPNTSPLLRLLLLLVVLPVFSAANANINNNNNSSPTHQQQHLLVLNSTSGIHGRDDGPSNHTSQGGVGGDGRSPSSLGVSQSKCYSKHCKSCNDCPKRDDCQPPYSPPANSPPYSPPAENSPPYSPPAENSHPYSPPAENSPHYSPPAENSPPYSPPVYSPPTENYPPVYSPPADNYPPQYSPPTDKYPQYSPPADNCPPKYSPPAENYPPQYSPPAENYPPQYSPPAENYPPQYSPPADNYPPQYSPPADNYPPQYSPPAEDYPPHCYPMFKPPFMCKCWGKDKGFIHKMLGYEGTIGDMIGIIGMGAIKVQGPMMGPDTSLEQMLNNPRNDGYGALYREGTAAYLNSMAANNFYFSTQQVRDSFLASLGSDGTAARQARLFQLANEGKLKN